jgi:ubiquinone/menaquinone biosynthesis C-methylase UbiE
MKNMRQLVKDAYNQCADGYSLKRDMFKNQKYLNELNKYLKSDSKILDVGCGAGIPIDKYLVSKGHKVTGVDISEKQIELAKMNVPEAIYIVKDMTEINFLNNSFDAVVSFYAIFHIPKEEHLEMFKKIYNFLKRGGLFLTTLGFEEWDGSEEFHGVTMHWSQYGKDKNLELIKQAGFKIIKTEVDNSGGEHHLVVLAKKP